MGHAQSMCPSCLAPAQLAMTPPPPPCQCTASPPPQADAASQELTSAGLLNLLHHRLGALGGDAAGRALVERLLAAAAGPYFEILGGWLSTGVLDDPYNEFMVKVRGPRGAASASAAGRGSRLCAYAALHYRTLGCLCGQLTALRAPSASLHKFYLGRRTRAWAATPQPTTSS
jgi:hypothetical protein